MRRAWIPFTITVALAASACRSSSGSAGLAALSAPGEAGLETELEILDPRIVALGQDRALEFRLRNASGHDLEFRFGVDWFDARGNPVGLAPRGWTALALERHVAQPIRVEPIPPEASSWRLRFSSAEGRH